MFWIKTCCAQLFTLLEALKFWLCLQTAIMALKMTCLMTQRCKMYPELLKLYYNTTLSPDNVMTWFVIIYSYRKVLDAFGLLKLQYNHYWAFSNQKHQIGHPCLFCFCMIPVVIQLSDGQGFQTALKQWLSEHSVILVSIKFRHFITLTCKITRTTSRIVCVAVKPDQVLLLSMHHPKHQSCYRICMGGLFCLSFHFCTVQTVLGTKNTETAGQGTATT